MKYLLISISLLFIQECWSQQESQFANVISNPFIVNPAAGGMAGVMQFETTARRQWLGYKGGPRTMMFTGNSQIKTGRRSVLSEFNAKSASLFKNPKPTTGALKHIVGGKFINDAIGPFSKTSVYGSYAIHMPFMNDMNFGVGLGAGWSNFRINQDRVVLFQDDDQTYASFLGNSSSQNIFDANAGLVFYNERFFGGLSVSQALKNDVVFNNVETQSSYNRHLFLIAKYKLDVNTDFQLEPSVFIKYAENSPLSADIGAKVLYHDAIWLGLQYRTSNAFIVQVGVNLVKNLYLSYAYEFSNGVIRTAQNGTHEINLGIYIGNNRKVKKEMEREEKKKEVQESKEQEL
ncbi:MAG: PorP/SprF family type IX secretion system membrane protein [Fluviicola sp.]|nr:PorP/SprF family type IX secretion system membrane protein [Fluviicola sp.]